MKYHSLYLIILLLLSLIACSSSGKAAGPINTTSSPVAFHPTDTVRTITESVTPTAAKTVTLQEVIYIHPDGITAKLLDITYSKSITKIKLQIWVDPRWQFNADTFPPQQAWIQNLILLDDNNRKYALHYITGGLPLANTSLGGVNFEYEAEFDSVSTSAQSLILEGIIELTEIPANRPLLVTISDRQIGERWELNENVLIRNIPVTIKQARLSWHENIFDQLPTKQPMLEFTTNTVERNGLRLVCLFVQESPPDADNYHRNSYDCASNSDQITSTVVIKPAVARNSPLIISKAPLQFAVKGSIAILRPWRLHWVIQK